MSSKKKVGIWLRVSTEDQAKGESPEHHEKRARMYAEVKGWEVVTVYHLEGISGKSVVEHPEAVRMMKDIQAGTITGLIFSKLARLARSTKQLLDFADFFKEFSADLISLQEAIDTSSPAGRLFYTLIAAMAQWEREEIADRVKASVPIRAKLGKSLGGQAPFGYQWKDHELMLNEAEAPVRKLMFELFLEQKRKKTVARLLNERGYRTRKGAKFTATTVTRLLSDPIAKGMRRANYTQSLGKDKAWVTKPSEEWVFIPAPAVVSEELWNQVNTILGEQAKTNRKPPRKPAHIFSGLARCHCGGKMYVPSNSLKYTCYTCRNKIGEMDLEEIFREQLQAYMISDEEINRQLGKFSRVIQEKKQQLELLFKEVKTIQAKMDKLFELHLAGQIPTESFNQYFQPLSEQQAQVETAIPTLQAEIDHLTVQYQSSDQVLSEAKDLYGRWTELSFPEKRKIAETIVESIIIDKDELEINVFHIPTPTTPIFSKKPIKGAHNLRDSCSRPT